MAKKGIVVLIVIVILAVFVDRLLAQYIPAVISGIVADYKCKLDEKLASNRAITAEMPYKGKETQGNVGLPLKEAADEKTDPPVINRERKKGYRDFNDRDYLMGNEPAPTAADTNKAAQGNNQPKEEQSEAPEEAGETLKGLVGPTGAVNIGKVGEKEHKKEHIQVQQPPSEITEIITDLPEEEYAYLDNEADEDIPIPQLPLTDSDFEVDTDDSGTESILMPELPEEN